MTALLLDYSNFLPFFLGWVQLLVQMTPFAIPITMLNDIAAPSDCISLTNLITFSSNVNEVIREVLNSFFFYKKILHAPKAPKALKSTKTQPSKSRKCYKRTKIKNTLKKHLTGKKSLIRLFAFLCLRKKKSLQCKCTKNTDVPTTRFM